MNKGKYLCIFFSTLVIKGSNLRNLNNDDIRSEQVIDTINVEDQFSPETNNNRLSLSGLGLFSGSNNDVESVAIQDILKNVTSAFNIFYRPYTFAELNERKVKQINILRTLLQKAFNNTITLLNLIETYPTDILVDLSRSFDELVDTLPLFNSSVTEAAN